LNPTSWLERFLFQFDYASKVKYVIGIAMFSACYVLFTFFQTITLYTQNIRIHTAGVSYQKPLNELLEKAMHFQMSSEHSLTALSLNEIEIFQNKIDEIFYNINVKQQEIESQRLPIVQENLQRFNTDLTIMERYWKEIKKQILRGILDSNVLMQWIESIYSMIISTNEIFALNLNFDRGNRYLIKIFNSNLPEIEMLTLNISQRIKFLKEQNTPHPYDVPLLTLLKRLNKAHETFKEQIETVRMSQNLIADKKTLTEESDFVVEFITAIDAYETFLYKAVFAENNLPSVSGSFFTLLKSFGIDTQLVAQDKLRSIDTKVLSELERNLIDSSFKLQGVVGDELDQLLAQQKRILNHRSILSTLFIIFGIVIVLMLYMTRVIRRPLADLKNAAIELANGNLSVRVKITSQDEVAQMSAAFNKMAQFFEDVLVDAGKITTHLAQSSSNIFSTAKQLETSLDQQEQSINQITNNAKGISRTVQDFAHSLQEVNNAATLTTHLATLSRKSLIEMETIMQQMANASTNIVTTLSTLKEKVVNINTIISTIVKIADQVNLLSLNTAIRAGKKGLKHPGFTVIAEKIRELADQTAYATLDMEMMVQQIISAVMEAVNEVGNFSTKIQKQLEEAVETRELLKKLITHTQTQISSFGIVNEGMQGQTMRAAQIHEAINRLTEASQRTIQSVRNLYLEIEYLYHASNNLHATTNLFIANSTPQEKTD
jgi:methyl-accepting chemotaxis protein WspA